MLGRATERERGGGTGIQRSAPRPIPRPTSVLGIGRLEHLAQQGQSAVEGGQPSLFPVAQLQEEAIKSAKRGALSTEGLEGTRVVGWAELGSYPNSAASLSILPKLPLPNLIRSVAMVRYQLLFSSTGIWGSREGHHKLLMCSDLTESLNPQRQQGYP